MAIFSTRSSKRDAEQAPTKNVPIDSIETLRTRARQRLIGAVVLVALGIITFTLLFDSQPRPIPVDIKITMPDKDNPGSTISTGGPAPTVPVAPTVSAAEELKKEETSETVAKVAAASAVQASASLSAKEEIVAPKTEAKTEAKTEVKAEVKAEPKAETKPVAKPEVKLDTKPVTKPEIKPEIKPIAKPVVSNEAAKALAILEGKEPPKTVVTPSTEVAERFIVQFGAFAENEKAREARLKVERAGMKTYVHVATTPTGKLIRVRSGPFTTRAEAEKVAAKIKSLGLTAAILTL
jgi:DedD protein